ncbi:patatin-like phospholipase family protein [Streptomyces anandii]|uniref:patatin-like phospholipase family protein n=1 Tax=Streptomyces anandii TaxID=285454 RepID=UPI00370185BD
MPPGRPARAFVLGGGGALGAHEVGMLKALLEAGLGPDLVVGTSVGAINGVMVAADPTPAAIERLADLPSAGAAGPRRRCGGTAGGVPPYGPPGCATSCRRARPERSPR